MLQTRQLVYLQVVVLASSRLQVRPRPTRVLTVPLANMQLQPNPPLVNNVPLVRTALVPRPLQSHAALELIPPHQLPEILLLVVRV